MITISYLDMLIVLLSVFALTYGMFDCLDLIKYKSNDSKCANQSSTKKIMVSQKESIRGRNISRLMNKY